jgi:hypothetical protein
VAEAAAALLEIGQQVMQQQGPDEPTVCFALVPLLVPAVVIVALALGRRVRRLGSRAA